MPGATQHSARSWQQRGLAPAPPAAARKAVQTFSPCTCAAWQAPHAGALSAGPPCQARAGLAHCLVLGAATCRPLPLNGITMVVGITAYVQVTHAYKRRAWARAAASDALLPGPDQCSSCPPQSILGYDWLGATAANSKQQATVTGGAGRANTHAHEQGARCRPQGGARTLAALLLRAQLLRHKLHDHFHVTLKLLPQKGLIVPRIRPH